MRRALAALVLALPFVASPAAAQIDRDPYVQQGTRDSMIVAWRTATAEEGVVCWGPSPDALADRATGPSDTQHEVRIGGLTPDTPYHYAVTSGACPPAGGGDPLDHFSTAPAPGTPRPFRFWVVGDSGTGGTRQGEVRDAMLTAVGTARPDLFLHVGDMAYDDGTTTEFDDNFFAPYRHILRNTPVWPAMGNHEGHSSDSDTETGPYYDAYVLPADAAAGGMPSGTEAYYAFDWANVHFIALDSHDSPRDVGGAMLTWLEADLASTDQDWIVAFWHHPPYSKGTHDSDTEGQLVDMRENALPLLEAGGVDVVLSGHSHIYERSYLLRGAFDTPTTAAGHVVDMGDGRVDGDGPYLLSTGGTLYVVAGHGGRSVGGDGDHPVMFFSEVDHGSCIVDVDGGVMTLRNIRYDGVETDHVTLVKGEGLFLLSPIGGETFLAGSTVQVTWTSAGTVGDVALDYSLDGGATWIPIVDRTDNDGVHAWVTPRRATTTGRVRITDLDDPTHTAESPGDFELSAVARLTPVPYGSVWEYRDLGVDQGTDWVDELGAGWASGPAQLGYGEGDEATELLDADPNVPTVYFRRGITLEQEVTAATLRVIFDDAIAVWVNGAQIYGYNVDDGLGFDAWASAGSDDNQEETVPIDLSTTNPFVIGPNIVAAIVKQDDASSSDLSFDLELTVEVQTTLDPDPPPDAGPASATDGGGVAPGTDGGGDAGEGPPPVTDDGGDACLCSAVGGTRRGAGRLPQVLAALLVGLAYIRRRR